jgi:geranylgeranyl transferase type-1 subunit beta
MTYTALASLAVLGDDFSRIRRREIAHALRYYQLEDGSFRCSPQSGEHDMRFNYCACCIAFMLNDWSGVDQDKLVAYILGSLRYDHGFGQGPGEESHGGSTFCALASLSLMVFPLFSLLLAYYPDVQVFEKTLLEDS